MYYLCIINVLAIAVPQRVVSIQFVHKAKGMLLRCLRITENKLMSIRQIRMRKNQILKNIHSFSTERVLHDPAELFGHLCVSTCYDNASVNSSSAHAPPGQLPGINIYWEKWANSRGWGHMSCLNAPGRGRRKRANARPPRSSSSSTSAVLY